MPTKISVIETLSRQRLIEPVPNFWSSDEIVQIVIAGVKDLWRDVVDLKQEHYLTVNTTDVTLQPSTGQLQGVPTDVHKVYMIKPVDATANSANVGLVFHPADLNHKDFVQSQTLDAIEPRNSCIYYAITGQGAPVNAPIIYIAPKVTLPVSISFAYVPTLGSMTSDTIVPIPGEADNALVAWTVSYARAKEREDRSPDPNWLGIYSTEKQHLLQSLGLREYQAPKFVDALFAEYWG